MTSPQIRTLWLLSALFLVTGIALAAWQLQTIPTDTIALEQGMATLLGELPEGFDGAAYLAQQTEAHRYYAGFGALIAALGAVAGFLALAAGSIGRSVARP